MSGASHTTTAELLGSTRDETATLLNYATQIVTLSEDNRSDALKQALVYLDQHLPPPNPGRAFWSALLEQCRAVKDLDELHKENLFPSPAPLGLSDLFIAYESSDERTAAIKAWLDQRSGLWNSNGQPSRRSNPVTGSHSGSRRSSHEREHSESEHNQGRDGDDAVRRADRGKGRRARSSREGSNESWEEDYGDDNDGDLHAMLTGREFENTLDRAAKAQIDRAAAVGADRARAAATPRRRSSTAPLADERAFDYGQRNLSQRASPAAHGLQDDDLGQRTSRDRSGLGAEDSGTRRSSAVRRFDFEARGLDERDVDGLEKALIRNLAGYAHVQPHARDEYNAKTQDLAIASRRMSKEDLERMLKTLALDMPLDVAVSIVRNEWVDLAKIHGWEEKSSEKVAVADDNDGTLRIKLGTQAKSVEPSTALQWQRAFSKYRALASVVYPHRRDEFRHYEEHMARYMDEYGPSAFALWYEYDGQFRRRLGTTGFASKLNEVVYEQTLKMHVVFASKAFLQSRLDSGSSGSTKRSGSDGSKRASKKSKSEKSRPQPTGQAFKCKNWNAKRGECAGSGSCPHDRRHVCDFDGCSEAHRRVDAHKQ